MVGGVTGLNGGHAQDHVVQVCQCKQENATTQHQFMAVLSVSVNEQDTKPVTLIHVQRQNQVFGHSNVQRRTIELLKDKSSLGSPS